MRRRESINALAPYRRALALLALTLTCSAGHAAPAAGPPAIKASAAILVDAVSGQVLYAKNPDLQRPPASTTKIMTAILLLENTKPDDVLTASKKASETDGSALHLKFGERVTARDMLYALMLRSANDGCVAVAEHIGGNEQSFVELMNRKAQEIGATRTHFGNCNGLNCDGHVSTARDLALMARYASRYPEFNLATQTKFYTIGRTMDKHDVVLRNHAKFLWRFPGADGVKTGYTVPAGHCFVGAATWGGWRLISVVMKSPDCFGETAKLLKYGFDHYKPVCAVKAEAPFATVPVQNGRAKSLSVVPEGPVQYILQKGAHAATELRTELKPVQAPVAARAVVGRVDVWDAGKLVGSTNLLAAAPVERSPVANLTGLGRGWYLFSLLIGTVAVKYGTAFAKVARGRRSRLQALLRRDDRPGAR